MMIKKFMYYLIKSILLISLNDQVVYVLFYKINLNSQDFNNIIRTLEQNLYPTLSQKFYITNNLKLEELDNLSLLIQVDSYFSIHKEPNKF